MRHSQFRRESHLVQQMERTITTISTATIVAISALVEIIDRSTARVATTTQHLSRSRDAEMA